MPVSGSMELINKQDHNLLALKSGNNFHYLIVVRGFGGEIVLLNKSPIKRIILPDTVSTSLISAQQISDNSNPHFQFKIILHRKCLTPKTEGMTEAPGTDRIT